MQKIKMLRLSSFYFLVLSVIYLTACQAQEERSLPVKSIKIAKVVSQDIRLPGEETQTLDLQISKNVSQVHQSKSGDLWIATYGDGIIRYDGEAYEFFTISKDYLAVRAIVEDDQGIIWFGTSEGLMKYDGTGFSQLTALDGLADKDIWSMAKDEEGSIWIGTAQGINQFDGASFTDFELPEVEADKSREVVSRKIVHSIMQDSKGNMWFGTNGGAFIYDGKDISKLSEEDGLCNNSVNGILEDKQGNIWMATRHNGICRWDGSSFTSFGEADGIKGKEVIGLYQDQQGHIWFPVKGIGLYRYDGTSFSPYFNEQSCVTHTFRCTTEDLNGNLWFGGSIGLYQFEG